MAQKLTNEDNRILRIYADHLPIVWTGANEAHIMTGEELKEMGYVFKPGEKVPDKDGEAQYCAPVAVARNHYSRLKDAWFEQGEEGIRHYIMEVMEIWKDQFQMEGTYHVKPFTAGKVIQLFGKPDSLRVTFTDTNGGNWTTELLISKEGKEATVEIAKKAIRDTVVNKMLELQYAKLLNAIAESEHTKETKAKKHTAKKPLQSQA